MAAPEVTGPEITGPEATLAGTVDPAGQRTSLTGLFLPGGRRIGPRPLALHLATAGTTLTGAMASVPAMLGGAIPWHPDLSSRAEALATEMRGADPVALMHAVAAEASRRMQATFEGIERYQTHPYRRSLPEPPAIWSSGSARLLDYGVFHPDTADRRQPVLFVPSLVNRGYVLDLMADSSLVRWLAEATGIRPLLMDWGSPGTAERDYDIADYLDGPLNGALEAAAALTPEAPGRSPDRRVPVIGYCMGGTMAVALALRRPDRVRALGLLASPWDFHADLSPQGEAFAAALPLWEPVLTACGEMPVDILQAFFAALDPNLAQKKFARFAALDPASPQAEQFVALEDWLNDGVPLTPGVARDCLVGWYTRNRAARGTWLVRETRILPEHLTMPVFAAIPAKDRIVPPASARAAVARVPHATIIEPRAGHIGMVVGSRARDSLWAPLSRWLETLPDRS